MTLAAATTVTATSATKVARVARKIPSVPKTMTATKAKNKHSLRQQQQ